MIRLLTCVALCLAAPVSALTVDQLEGRWQGEGALVLGNEPEQRLRCRIRLRTIDQGQSFFSGRCATAQASQSFTYMLFETPRGRVTAENRAEFPGELPQTMQGIAAPGLLRVEAGEGRVFELRLEGDVMHFRIEGSGDRGLAVGAARLVRRQ